MAVWRFFFISSATNSHYSLQQAATPDPASSNFKKKFANVYFNLQQVSSCFTRPDG
jgi:hypothetical protein